MSALLKKLFLTALVAGFLAPVLSGRSALAGMLLDLDPGSSNSIKLSELLDGTHDGVTVGDKVFNDFFYSTIGDMPEAEEVNVFGFTDENDNVGISLHGAFLDLPGGGFSDALIRFTVEVSAKAQQAGWRISDAHLFVGGIGVGENSIFTVDESYEGRNDTLNVYATSLGQGEKVLSDWVDIEPVVSRLRVTKDIFAIASADAILPARASVVDQTFSQVQIPEPATLSMLAMSLVGTLFVSRRRQN